MQELPGKRAMALVFGLAIGAAGSAFAQDTTETGAAPMDTTAPAGGAIDTSGVDTSAARDTTDTLETTDTLRIKGDTSGRQTDTSGVQNPPGYRGMERDTTIFPDSGGPPPSAQESQNQTTGTYSDSAWRDTSGAAQNPAGYRGMERPVGDSAAAQDSGAGHEGAEGHDTTSGTHEAESGQSWNDSTAQTPDSTP